MSGLLLCSPLGPLEAYGAAACEACPAGYVSSDADTHCAPCPAGATSDVSGQSCGLCPESTFAPEPASPACTLKAPRPSFFFQGGDVFALLG